MSLDVFLGVGAAVGTEQWLECEDSRERRDVAVSGEEEPDNVNAGVGVDSTLSFSESEGE